MDTKELHLTRKDFKVTWFSGQGAGGQHRNKSSNCCRITHIATGLTVQGTGSRSRISNQREAFRSLAKMVVSFYLERENVRGKDTPAIRNYHGVRNEVHDKASGLKQPYKFVVDGANIGDMIEARNIAMISLSRV